jgi:peptidoglycan hydrolase CwlO-like protein
MLKQTKCKHIIAIAGSNWQEVDEDLICNNYTDFGRSYCNVHNDKNKIDILEGRARELDERVSSLVTQVISYQEELQEEQFKIDQLICEIDERNSLSFYDKIKYFIKTRIERW